MKLKSIMQKLAKTISDEAARNPQFEQKILDILTKASAAKKGPNTKSGRAVNRRPPAQLDPDIEIAIGEANLRHKLAELNIEQLKDIVAEYGMDPSKLVMKWKSPIRIIDRIVEVTLERSKKGDEFR